MQQEVTMLCMCARVYRTGQIWCLVVPYQFSRAVQVR